MDGFRIDNRTLSKSKSTINFVVNNLNETANQIVPVTQGAGINPVLVSIGGAILTTTAEMVRAARSVQPGESYRLPDRLEELHIPILRAEFDLVSRSSQTVSQASISRCKRSQTSNYWVMYKAF